MANGEGTIRVHVPFSLTNLAQCKQRLGRFLEDPSKSAEGFQALTLAFDSTWKDVQIVLSICCTPEEKQRLGEQPRGTLTSLPGTNPNILLWVETQSQIRSPSREGTEARKHMIQCILEGMRKCIKKPVNYEEVKGVTQEEKEHPALFQGRLVEAFRKFTNIDPSTPGGKSLPGQHFISESAPDIRRKLQKLQLGPQTPMS